MGHTVRQQQIGAPSNEVPYLHQSSASTCDNALHKTHLAHAGATQAHKLRPVDVLNHILKEDRPGKLEQFFAAYGSAEASAMCYLVATSNVQEASSVGLLDFMLYMVYRCHMRSIYSYTVHCAKPSAVHCAYPSPVHCVCHYAVCLSLASFCASGNSTHSGREHTCPVSTANLQMHCTGKSVFHRSDQANLQPIRRLT